MSKQNVSVYTYEDYRVYLRDFFSLEKRLKPFFSQRFFARKAGFASHSFCNYLVNGKRNLTDSSAEQMLRALGLHTNEANYFRVLVKFTQSKSREEREVLYRELNFLRRKTLHYRLYKNQFRYLEKWYYPVIRELVIGNNWGGDYAVLAKMLRPQIKAAEAKEAVETLLEIGLLEKTPEDTFMQRSDSIAIENVPNHLVKSLRATYFALAQRASEEVAPSDRHLSCATVKISRRTYGQLCSLLDELREKAITLALEEQDESGIFQLNLQLFPLSVLPEYVEGHDEQQGNVVAHHEE